MAWGSSKPKTPPPPRSTLAQIVPLVLTFLFLGILAFVGFHIYNMANQLTDRASRKLEKKNVVFTKDGMKVGVKEKKSENYVDQTQNVLVKVWNYSAWPAYKSRYWSGDAKVGEPTGQRQPYSRQSSTTSVKGS
ncbi:MAG: hypothetical protein M1824_000193 [Vezdaea acicularis]|nr:MAG: hypothetical protein M1824_000193 [Vezdaea acicularis]